MMLCWQPVKKHNGQFASHLGIALYRHRSLLCSFNCRKRRSSLWTKKEKPDWASLKNLNWEFPAGCQPRHPDRYGKSRCGNIKSPAWTTAFLPAAGRGAQTPSCGCVYPAPHAAQLFSMLSSSEAFLLQFDCNIGHGKCNTFLIYS